MHENQILRVSVSYGSECPLHSRIRLEIHHLCSDRDKHPAVMGR